MNHPRQITTLQIAGILISTIIGVGVLPLPLFAARAADSAAPLVTLAAILVASGGLYLIALLGKRFPEQTLIEYSEVVLGKWIARIGSIFIILFFSILTSLTAREFGEVVITSVLKRTPVEVTVMVMLVLAMISVRNGTTTFAYIHHFYLPIIVGPGLVIVMLSLKNAEFLNLQPIVDFSKGGQMFEGILTISALFQGTFILTAVIPSMRSPSKVMSACFWGMFIAGGLYFLIVLATVSVFGAEETKLMLWPTLELAKTTSLPAQVLERLDAAFLAIWVTAVFTTLLSSYFLTIQSISKLVRTENHKLFALFLLPYIFLMAMIPENILEMYGIIEFVGRLGLLITIGYPALIWFVAVARKKKGANGHGTRNEPSA